MDDMILLYIDNCEQALNGVLQEVENSIRLKKKENQVKRMRHFIQTWVPNIMRKAKDHESEKCLLQEIAELKADGNDKPEYWQGVYAYYRQKYDEGCRPTIIQKPQGNKEDAAMLLASLAVLGANGH